MKREYCKPTLFRMELRPEERLAACDWPIGFNFSEVSCVKTFAEVQGWQVVCQNAYNNAPTIGS